MNQLSMFEAVAQKDRILEAFEQDHDVYLTLCRGIAKDLIRRDGQTSIDEVREELSRRSLPMPKDIGVDERVFGALFRSKEFRYVGSKRTSREAWAARIGRSRDSVGVYAL